MDQGHDAASRRIHPPLSDARPAQRLPPHSPLRPVRQPRRAANIAHLRELLANADDASQPFGDAGMGVADAASADLADAFAIAKICPCCGGRMSVVETFARGAQPRSFKADAARIDTS